MNYSRQTYISCTKKNCQGKPTRYDDLNCPAVGKDQNFKKWPTTMETTNLPTLIVVPSDLVSLWEREYSKSISNGALRIWTSHLGQQEIFTDLYQSLEGGTANDHRLYDIVVLTSTEVLNSSIMRKDTYYQYARKKPGQRSPKKIGRIQFARVLVDEAHDIKHVDTVLKNLMTLAGDGASIWFITGAPLTHGTKSLAGFIKCWDATALAKRLHKPLTSRFTEIRSGCNKAFSRKTAAEASSRQDLVELAETDMNVEARGFAEIMLIFGIQRRADTSFQGKRILDLTPPTLKYEWVGFLIESLSHRYREYYSKVLDEMEDGTLANHARSGMRTLAPCLNLMRMSRIYASIPGLLEIPGC